MSFLVVGNAFSSFGNGFSLRAWPWQARARVAFRKTQHFVGLLPQTVIPAVLLEQHECQMLCFFSSGNAFRKVGNAFILSISPR